MGILLAALLGVGLAWPGAPAWAQPPLPLEAQAGRLSLGPHLEVLEDPQGAWSLADITSPELAARFRPHADRMLHLGLTSSAWWLRFRAAPDPQPPGGRSWMLEVVKPLLAEVDYFAPRPRPETGWNHAPPWQAPVFWPASLPGRDFVFELPRSWPPGEHHYLRLRGPGLSLAIPLHLYPPQAFVLAQGRDNLLFGALYGVLLGMILYNLSIFISLRDPNYLYYVLYMLGLAVYMACFTGDLTSLFPLSPEQGRTLLYFALGLAMLFGGAFTRGFLLARANAPVMDRLIMVFMLGGGLLMALALAGLHQAANRVAIVQALGSAPGAMLTGLICWRRGFQPARYFLLAWSFSLLGVFSFALTINGLLPYNTLGYHGLFLGSAAEAVLLSFALSDRIKILRDEREAFREGQRRYQELSRTDGLTRLFNARHFHAQLEAEVNEAQRLGRPLSLLVLDIDNFKRFNDTHGHQEGDRVLGRLGEVVRECVRGSDSAYRQGGEEFAVILPGALGGSDVAVAERIRRRLAAQAFHPQPGLGVQVTVSLGVARLRPTEPAPELLKRADQAMYQAKAQGKNQTAVAA